MKITNDIFYVGVNDHNIDLFSESILHRERRPQNHEIFPRLDFNETQCSVFRQSLALRRTVYSVRNGLVLLLLECYADVGELAWKQR